MCSYSSHSPRREAEGGNKKGLLSSIAQLCYVVGEPRFNYTTYSRHVEQYYRKSPLSIIKDCVARIPASIGSSDWLAA